ncbi:MAG TPA: preprotein translocase subunit SecA [Tepidisphaeraceae bacterium]|nr:preprotein translocase subunit SecA [Tepidisphaeraceae bacterium]
MALTVSKVLTKVFGSRNERLLKRYLRIVAQINGLEQKVGNMTDQQLRDRTQELRRDLVAKKVRTEEIIPEAMAIIRESMDRHIGIREIFNPEQNFNPDNYSKEQFDDAAYEAYDSVERMMIASGMTWQQVPIPLSVYQAIRKLFPESRPPFRARCFDVQLIGGLVLYEGKIAEMATGEGKTFVAPLACFLRALEGMHCHVVTVNDYLVRRDSMWVKPAFENLGITVGYIQSDMDPGSDARKKAYQCDITYGTNAEFGFDYLRDNMKERRDLQVQGPLDYAIVDEVDSILIDEARTPLIISGAAHDDAPKYRAADEVARKVIELNKPWDAVEREVDQWKRAIKSAQGDEDKARTKEEKEAARQREEEAVKKLAEAEAKKTGLVQHYEVELDRKSVHLTHEGIAAAQEFAGVGSFYVGNNMEWPHLMEQSLRAHVVYERDKDYVVERGGRTGEMEVIIVDEFTGRKMVGRQWSDGLHQAVEAKERVQIKQETQTLATITLQNFFKLYKQIAGMTGTAQTEAEEFSKIYRLEVVTIPTNRPCVRADSEDRVYRTEREKWVAIIDEIKQYSDAGRPVLVGTTSVEKSEMLSKMLTHKYGVKHEVLNAKFHEREAQIVVLAGQTHKNAHGQIVGNVTIATNMAGRGTDIKLAPEALFEIQKVESGTYKLIQGGTRKEIIVNPDKEDDQIAPAMQLSSPTKIAGGLHVIGTERHTARRIDNQLRGRSGRQGDPGSSRFYVSLEDELMKLFAGEWTIKVLSFLGMEEGMAIEDRRISKGILRAQKKVEERNFLARKNLLEYDEVMDVQRSQFYGMRQKVLDGEDIDKIIWGMIGESIEDAVQKYIDEDYVAACVAEWARSNFDVNVDPEDVKGMRRIDDLEDYIKGQARAEVETSLSSTLNEFMGEERGDSSQWDTKSLQSWAMSRFQVQFSQSQMKKMTADEVEDHLKTAALEQIEKRDCAGLMKYLEPNYQLAELSSWAESKFGIKVPPEEMLADVERGIPKNSPDIISLVEKRARDSYQLREIEYPVDTMLLYTFGQDGQDVTNPYAWEHIVKWAWMKYRIELPVEKLRAEPIRKLRDDLLAEQEAFLEDGKIEVEVDALIKANPQPDALVKAANQRFILNLTIDDLTAKPRAEVRGPVQASNDAQPVNIRELLISRGKQFIRRELTELEQFVLINIFDQSWKDHLYAMDMLKAGIGLQAFAERDPRIAYKREGFRYFQEMMAGVRDKVTDLIFRARVVGQAQARNAYQVTAATHETNNNYGVSGAAEGGEMRQAAEQKQGEGAKVKTITRDTPRVGRNDPCPCGSGKKYKKCHGANAA